MQKAMRCAARGGQGRRLGTLGGTSVLSWPTSSRVAKSGIDGSTAVLPRRREAGLGLVLRSRPSRYRHGRPLCGTSFTEGVRTASSSFLLSCLPCSSKVSALAWNVHSSSSRRHSSSSTTEESIIGYQRGKPSTMKAAVVVQYDMRDSNEVDPASIEVQNNLPIPSIRAVESRHDEGDVLVQVAASSVNPIDCMLRRGYGRALLESYAGPGRSRLPFIPGFDVAGTVVDVGTGVWNFKKGDLVWAGSELFRNGAHAEYIAINQHALALKPKNLTMEEAASIPFVALTSWRALVDTAGLSSSGSKNVFINGGSGGIGVFSIQLLKNWGHTVLASCGEQNVSKLVTLGCDRVINYQSTDFQQFLTAKESVDVILDTVGGAKSEAQLLPLVRPGGHYLSLRGPLATMTDSGGLVSGLLNAATTIAKKKISAFTQDQRHVHVDYIIYKPNGDVLREVSELVETNRIRPDIDRIFHLNDIYKAHQYLESGKAKGKVVIKVKN